jgi:hypothetical protein
MIEILGIKLTYETLLFLVLFLVSEVLPYTRLKDNSVTQLVLHAAKTLKPFRKEDDKIERIKAQLDAINKELRG